MDVGPLIKSLLQIFLASLRLLMCTCRGSCLLGFVDGHGPKGFEGETPPLPWLQMSSWRMGSMPRKPCARSWLPKFAHLGEGALEGCWNLACAPQKFISRSLKLLGLFFHDSQRQGEDRLLHFFLWVLTAAASAGLELGGETAPLVSPVLALGSHRGVSIWSSLLPSQISRCRWVPMARSPSDHRALPECMYFIWGSSSPCCS